MDFLADLVDLLNFLFLPVHTSDRSTDRHINPAIFFLRKKFALYGGRESLSGPAIPEATWSPRVPPKQKKILLILIITSLFGL